MQEIDKFASIPVEIQAELDRRSMSMRDIARLEKGSLVRLGRSAGEPISIRVGGAILGYGEIVVIENQVCVRLTKLKDSEAPAREAQA